MLVQYVSLSPGSRNSGAPHDGQVVGNRQGGGRSPAPGPSVQGRTDDLGDDVAGLAHDDGVPRADILQAHLVLVVQRRHRHGGPTDEHRLEHREGRRATGATDRHHDVLEERRPLLRGELEGDRPTRRP